MNKDIEISMLTGADAEEFSQTLEQSGSTFWRQILLAKKMGVPGALGMTLKQWTEERIGAKIKLSIEDRLAAINEIKGENPKITQTDIAAVLGVSHDTISKDLKNQEIENSINNGSSSEVFFENSINERAELERELSQPDPDPIKATGEEMIAQLELDQETQFGITVKAAGKLVTKALTLLNKDQNEKAKRYLAKLMVEFLLKTYPDLESESLEP